MFLFFLERVLSIAKVAAAVAQAFGLDREEVIILPNSEKSLEFDDWDGDGVWGVLQNIGGDFPYYLQLFFRSASFKVTESQVALELTRLLETRSLIPDDSANPATMLLVADGQVFSAWLDMDEWGENRCRIGKIVGEYQE